MNNTYNKKKVTALSFRLSDLNNTLENELQNRLPNQLPFFRKDKVAAQWLQTRKEGLRSSLSVLRDHQFAHLL